VLVGKKEGTRRKTAPAKLSYRARVGHEWSAGGGLPLQGKVKEEGVESGGKGSCGMKRGLVSLEAASRSGGALEEIYVEVGFWKMVGE